MSGKSSLLICRTAFFGCIRGPIIGVDGNVLALLEAVVEITDKNHLIELFNVLSDPIFVVDVETMRFLEANEVGLRRLGYSREELLTMTLAEIDPIFSQDQLPLLLERLKQSEPLLLETVNRDAQGVLIPVEVHAKLIYYRGRKALLGVSRNIEQRKATELLRDEARARGKSHFG